MVRSRVMPVVLAFLILLAFETIVGGFAWRQELAFAAILVSTVRTSPLPA